MTGVAAEPDAPSTGLVAVPTINRSWRRSSVRELTNPVSRKGFPDFQVLSVYRDYGVIPKDSRDDNHNATGEDLTQYKAVFPGDLVLNKMKTWQGSLGISDHQGLVSPAYITCEVTPAENRRFLHYLLRSKPYIHEYNRISFGVRVGQWDMRYEDFREIPVYLPPRSEQDAIVAYLDGKLEAIDRYLRVKEREIELLEERKRALIHRAVTRGLDPNPQLQPSGIPWLPEIPAGWEMKPIKRMCSIQTGVTLGKTYTGSTVEPYPYLRVANVQNGSLDLEEVTEIRLPKHLAEGYLLRKGDVLVAEGGDLDKLGRGCVWTGEVNRCLHQNHVYALRPEPSSLSPHYLALALGSAYGQHYFIRTGKKTTNLASTNSTLVLRFPLPTPPIEEQTAILRGLEDETSKIETTITRARRQIERMQEYRTALIAEAVTGKIDCAAAS